MRGCTVINRAVKHYQFINPTLHPTISLDFSGKCNIRTSFADVSRNKSRGKSALKQSRAIRAVASSDNFDFPKTCKELYTE